MRLHCSGIEIDMWNNNLLDKNNNKPIGNNISEKLAELENIAFEYCEKAIFSLLNSTSNVNDDKYNKSFYNLGRNRRDILNIYSISVINFFYMLIMSDVFQF